MLNPLQPLARMAAVAAALVLLLIAAGLAAPAAAPPGAERRPRVKHFVTLLMENRAADHMLGCFGLPGFDGIPPEGRVLWNDPTNHSGGSVTVTCGRAPYSCGTNPVTHHAAKYPHYDIFAGKFAPPTAADGADPDPYPSDPGQPYPWGPGGSYPRPDSTCVTPGQPCGACTYPYAPQSDAHSTRRGAAGVDIMMYRLYRSSIPTAIVKLLRFNVPRSVLSSVCSESTGGGELMSRSSAY